MYALVERQIMLVMRANVQVNNFQEKLIMNKRKIQCIYAGSEYRIHNTEYGIQKGGIHFPQSVILRGSHLHKI